VKRAALVLATVLAAAAVSAQPGARRATNIGALTAYPGFFHGRQIMLVGRVSSDDSGARVTDDSGVSIRLVS
jgi:hypothetical protein